MSNIDDLAKQIGDAVMDAIEQNRRINKADLIDAAHNVLRRRQALLGMEPMPFRVTAEEAERIGAYIKEAYARIGG